MYLIGAVLAATVGCSTPERYARLAGSHGLSPLLLHGTQFQHHAFAAVRGKLDYEMLEIRRFIVRHGLGKFSFNPHFPVNTLMLMRGFIAARAAER